MLEPFADAGIARSALEACEIRNLKLYGYGAKAFTLSMIETALELGGDDVPASVIREILEAGQALHAHPVELFDGIEDTLDALADRARLVLVTKGDLFHQEAKLAASGLGDRFSGIEIVSDKQPADLRRGSSAASRCAPDRALMAGDSMRSDVIPALEAGRLGGLHSAAARLEPRAAPGADRPSALRGIALARCAGQLDRPRRGGVINSERPASRL